MEKHEEIHRAYWQLVRVFHHLGFIEEMTIDACEFIIWERLVELGYYND
jgi:hypothetical protein